MYGSIERPWLYIWNQKGTPAFSGQYPLSICLMQEATLRYGKGFIETVTRKNLPCVWASKGYFYSPPLKWDAFWPFQKVGRTSSTTGRKLGWDKLCFPSQHGGHRVRAQLCLWMALSHPRASGISCLWVEWAAAMRGRRWKHIYKIGPAQSSQA